MGLHGGVDRVDGGLGRGVLRHVRRLARTQVVTGVDERGRLLGHQPGQLVLDVRHRERVGHGLVRADRVLEDRALLGVRRRLGEGVAGEPGREGGGHDPLGVEAGEELHEPAVLVADQRVGGQPDVVDEDLELLLRAHDLHRDRGVRQAGGVGRHDEQAGLELAGPRVFRARDDQDVLGLVDAGDVDLLALEHPLVAVTAGGGGDVVGVGAGVGLGDREGHRRGAVADPGQPALLLRVRAVARDHGPADRRADDHHQQRAALGGQLLADGGHVADPAAATAVLLGHVDAEVAGLGDLHPQLGGLLAGSGALDEPLAAVAARQLRDLRAQLDSLLGLGETRHLCSLWVS